MAKLYFFQKKLDAFMQRGKLQMMGCITALIFLGTSAFAHTWEIRVKQNANGTLTWYGQSYHSAGECGFANSGININGTNYNWTSETNGSVVPLTAYIFTASPSYTTYDNSCGGCERLSYGTVTTPFIPGNLVVTAYSSNVCYALYPDMSAGGGPFNPPPPPCASCPLTSWSNTTGTANNNNTPSNCADDYLPVTITVTHQDCAKSSGNGQFTLMNVTTNTTVGSYVFNNTSPTSITFNAPVGTSNTMQYNVSVDYPCNIQQTLSIPGGTFTGVCAPVITCPGNMTVDATTGQCGTNVCYPSATATSSGAPATPAGFFFVASYGNSYYYQSTSYFNYADAQAAAIAAGGHLAVITSAAENNAIDAGGGGFAWLGGNDLDSDGVWKWSNCETNTYSNFCGGEPNGGIFENYLEFQTGGCWNDLLVNATRAALVEIEGTNLSQTSGYAQNALFPVGTTTNTFVATNNSGQTASCSFTVTVKDVEAPVVTCTDIVVNNTVGLCGAIVSIPQPVVTDNCPIPSSIALDFDGAGDYINTNYVLSGSYTKELWINIRDITNNANNFITSGGSTLSTPNYYGGILGAGNNSPWNTVSDNGPIPLNTWTHVAVTYDANTLGMKLYKNGILISSAANVPPLTAGNVQIGAWYSGYFTNGILDEVRIWDVVRTQSQISANMNVEIDGPRAGLKLAYNFNEGIANGNNSGISIVNDASGNGNHGNIIGFSKTGNTSNWVNGSSNISRNTNNAPSIFPVGSTNVVWTTSDLASNTATCSFTVTVNDVEAPTVTCKTFTANLSVGGTASITTANVFQSGADNCGVVNQVSVTPNSFTCANVGANTVVLTVNDGNGNSSTCSAVVTIVDNLPPSALCKNISLSLSNAGTVSTNAAAVNNGSSDNCGNVSLTLSKTTFNCSNFGANAVILTVTDNSSNSATCTAIITIGYTQPPVAKCKNAIVVLSGAGNGSITIAGINNASTDLCSANGLTYSLSKSSFNCSNLGPNVVTLTVTNVAGNSSTCTGTVSVKDLVKPVAKCKAVSASVAPGGSLTVLAATVNNGSTDACTSPPNLSLSPNTFTCANAGANTVVLTVSDANPNVSTCTAVVTITCGGAAPQQSIGTQAFADYTELMDLFPNPAADKVNIRLSRAVSAATPVTILDNTGRTLYSGWVAEGSNQLQVDLTQSKLTSGIYLVSVKLADRVQTKSLVIFRD